MSGNNLLIMLGVLAAIPIVISLLKILVKIKKRIGILKKNAAKYNLEFRPRRKFRPCLVEGKLSDFDVRIYFKKLDRSVLAMASLVVEFDLNVSLPFEMYIMAGWAYNVPNLVDGLVQLYTGDSEFDSKVVLTSTDKRNAICRLHPKIRAIIYREIEHHKLARMKYSYGIIQFHYYDWNTFCNNDLEAAISRFSPLVEFMKRDGDRIELLRQNYLAEEKESARAVYLGMLVWLGWKPGPKHPILIEALKSSHFQLRMAAIVLLEKAGIPEIEKWFHTLSGTAQAEMLAYGAKKGWKELTDFFSGQYDNLRSKKALMAWLDYFLYAADSSVEPVFLDLIGNNKAAGFDYQEKVIKILGKCGSLIAVTALHNAKEDWNARLIDQEIARIQSRIGVGDSGWLSVNRPDEEEGTLALEDKER